MSDDRIWVTKGRFGEKLKTILGPEHLPILPVRSRLAKLVMIKAHSEQHRGAPEICMCNRVTAGIIQARPLAKRVVDKCAVCPIIWNVPLNQQLGFLPPEHLKFCQGPWTSTNIDLFGPLKVRDKVNKRWHGV